MPKGELTAKQQRFVEEYLIDLNATHAAIKAGYSAKGATVRGAELLANRKVAAEVARLSQKATKRAEVSAQDVLDGLYKEATREGEGTTHGARVAAWGYLGKYHKLFIDRIEAEVTHKFSSLSDSELDDAIRKLSGQGR